MLISLYVHAREVFGYPFGFNLRRGVCSYLVKRAFNCLTACHFLWGYGPVGRYNIFVSVNSNALGINTNVTFPNPTACYLLQPFFYEKFSRVWFDDVEFVALPDKTWSVPVIEPIIIAPIHFNNVIIPTAHNLNLIVTVAKHHGLFALQGNNGVGAEVLRRSDTQRLIKQRSIIHGPHLLAVNKCSSFQVRHVLNVLIVNNLLQRYE